MSERLETDKDKTLSQKVGFGRARLLPSQAPGSAGASPSQDGGLTINSEAAALLVASPKRRRRWVVPVGLVVVAIVALWRVGYEVKPSVTDWWESQRLASRIRNQNMVVADQAARRLADLGPAGVSVLLDAVHDRSETARALACKYLPQLRLVEQLEQAPALVGGGGGFFGSRLA